MASTATMQSTCRGIIALNRHLLLKQDTANTVTENCKHLKNIQKFETVRQVRYLSLISTYFNLIADRGGRKTDKFLQTTTATNEVSFCLFGFRGLVALRNTLKPYQDGQLKTNSDFNITYQCWVVTEYLNYFTNIECLSRIYRLALKYSNTFLYFAVI